MKRLAHLAWFGLAAFTCVLALRAQDTNRADATKPADKASQLKEDLGLREQILARQFGEFEQSLLKLVQRMERSPKQEDRDRAIVLRKVLDKAKDASISTQFEQIVDFLKREKLSSVPEIKTAMDRSGKLAEDLRDLLNLFREDTRSSKLRDERLRLEELVRQLEKVIHDQKVVQGQTDLNKTERKELEQGQARVTEDTNKLIKKIDGKGQPGEGKNQKGEPKDGGKSKGGKAGESKDAGKGGEKKGEAKEAKGSDGKQGEAKGGEKKPAGQGEPKEGTAKESKSGEGKQGEAKAGDKAGKGGEGKEGQAKSGEKSGEGKQGEAKTDDKKPGDDEPQARVKTKPEEKKEQAKGENKAGAKDGGQKEGQAKASKSGEAGKQGEPKSGGDPKQGEAKGGEQKSGQAQAKSGGQQQQDQPPPGAQKGDKAQQPQGPQDPKQDVANGKKQIQDAEYEMKKAEENINKGNNKDASDDQGKAIQKLEEARKKLEALLRQLREEELERLLANLQVRCERMLAMQMQVRHGTEQVFKAIEANEDKQANRENKQASLKLSDDEKEIVGEARKANEILEAEGSAVAFPEVFQQIRQDMEHVQRRLGIVDTGVVTQAIEQDIIDTLKEMIDALKKAQKEMQDKKSQPPQQAQQQPPQDQKLLEQIAELKMIRSMQIRVNNRTLVYGKQYQDLEGEQTRNPTIMRELRNLAERQVRIYEVTNRIAKGDNR